MQKYVYGFVFCAVTLNVRLVGMSYDAGRKISNYDGSIITSFNHTTPHYSSQLIALLKELPSLAHAESKVFDVRAIEALILQQIRMSLPQDSGFVRRLAEQQVQGGVVCYAEHNY